VYQVGKVTNYSQMMHGQPSIKIRLTMTCYYFETLLLTHDVNSPRLFM